MSSAYISTVEDTVNLIYWPVWPVAQSIEVQPLFFRTSFWHLQNFSIHPNFSWYSTGISYKSLGGVSLKKTGPISQPSFDSWWVATRFITPISFHLSTCTFPPFYFLAHSASDAVMLPVVQHFLPFENQLSMLIGWASADKLSLGIFVHRYYNKKQQEFQDLQEFFKIFKTLHLWPQTTFILS